MIVLIVFLRDTREDPDPPAKEAGQVPGGATERQGDVS